MTNKEYGLLIDAMVHLNNKEYEEVRDLLYKLRKGCKQYEANKRVLVKIYEKIAHEASSIS